MAGKATKALLKKKPNLNGAESFLKIGVHLNNKGYQETG